MSRSTFYFIYHGRFPSEKAAALFARLSASAMAKHMSAVVLVPRRLKRDRPEALPAGVRVVYLPTIDLFGVPILSRVAFLTSYAIFSISVLVYFFVKLQPQDIVESNESLPSFAATLLTRNVVYEVHDYPEHFKAFYKRLFLQARFVLATNEWKKKKLGEEFQIPPGKLLFERNGVDLEKFARVEKKEARETLSLPADAKIVVYTGQLYDWKGADTLAEAAGQLPHAQFYFVGGAAQTVSEYKEKFSASNIHFVGQKPHDEIPHWQAAADVLVLPNTAKENISAYQTSPMKLFEYMASGRPIVASTIPSIQEVLNSGNAYLVEADNPQSLKEGIEKALHDRDVHIKAKEARSNVSNFAWDTRAQRIMSHFMSSVPVPETLRFFAVLVSYAVLLGIVFAPFLFGHQIFLGSDVTTYYYAAFDFYHQALVSGQSFLLNPLIFSGFPMYLSQVAGYFDPINYMLFHFFNGFDGVNIRLCIDYFAVAVFSYLAGRSWKMSRVAAFCVGLAYILVFNETYISNPLLANSLFLMPLLVWVMGEIRTRGGWSIQYALITGVAIGLALLGGQAQSVVMDLTYFGIFGFLLTLLVVEEKKVRFFLKFVLFCFFSTLMGFLIGAPQILPALAFTPLTRRAGGLDFSLASLKSIAPGDGILFLYPDYTYFPYLSVGRKALYVGAMWFFLAVGMCAVALGKIKGKSEKSRVTLVFALMFLLGVSIAVTHSPLFYMLQHLPVYNLFRFSDRWMYGGIFFFAMLGGFGLDTLPNSKERFLKYWYFCIGGCVVLFLLVVCALNVLTDSLINRVGDLLMLIFSHTVYGMGPFTKDITHYKDAIVRGVEAWQSFTSLKDPSFLIPTLVVCAALLLTWAMVYQKLSETKLRCAILALMIATFVSVVFFQFSDRMSKERMDELTAQSFVRFIPKDDRTLYRYYPIFISEGFQQRVPPTYQLTHAQRDASLELAFQSGWPNTNVPYGVASVDGYDVFVTSEYIDTLATLGSTFGAQDYTRSLSTEEKKTRLYNNLSVVGMMGGKYIVSALPLSNMHLTELGQFKASWLHIPVYVYQNDLALPIVYAPKVVSNALGKSLTDLGAADFRDTTYLDCALCKGEGDVTISSFALKNGYAELSVEAQRSSGWVVFSQTLLPGWSASVDGKRAQITKANGLYMALEVPEGVHAVVFEYMGQPLH